MKIRLKRQKIIAGADFSAQEPRTMSSLCGERALIDGYNMRTPEFPKGKDFYAILASTAFGKDYWDCTEFDREGKFNQEGKNRRQAGKVIQLGVSYGMGVKLLVKGINGKKGPNEKPMTEEEGEAMMTNFFSQFKSLAAWKDYNMERLNIFGYMETGEGRRRRLYDVWLPDYDITAKKLVRTGDVFFNDKPQVIWVKDEKRTKEILKTLSEKNHWQQRDYLMDLHSDPESIVIRSNSGFKSKPKTQATNYTIQGSAAGLTKRALVAISKHPDRKRLGINILVPVHDEILIEGWMSDRQEVLDLLSTCMSNSAKGVFEVQMVCDGVIETSWNVSHFMDKVQKLYSKGGKTIPEIQAMYPETSPDDIRRMCLGEFNPEVDYFSPAEL